MSESEHEHPDPDQQDGPMSVTDDELPEDLRPSEDNPLAQPAGDDVPEDILKDTSGGSGGGSEDAEEGGDDAPRAPSDEASSDAESD